MTMTFTHSLRLLALPVLLACANPAAAAPVAPAPDAAEQARWERQARAVTITRDDWGLAHVHGPTDADAVFGMVYAQAEDDYNRIERNYLFALGRTAEADGEDAIWQDLRSRMYLPHAMLRQAYADSPGWRNCTGLRPRWRWRCASRPTRRAIPPAPTASRSRPRALSTATRCC